jgi:hypothetical protein
MAVLGVAVILPQAVLYRCHSIPLWYTDATYIESLYGLSHGHKDRERKRGGRKVPPPLDSSAGLIRHRYRRA